MALVQFVNDSAPYLNAENLNNNFNELNQALEVGDTVYSGDITATGTFDFTINVSDYRFLIVEMTTGTATQRTYCIIPGYKIIGNNAQWISRYIDGTIRDARIQINPTSFNVLTIDTSSYTHIRSIRGIK